MASVATWEKTWRFILLKPSEAKYFIVALGDLSRSKRLVALELK